MSFTKPKCFALVDCNNFYASCEQVFNPKLRNKPVVVLSNNDGCVISRSKEAKALGIAMGAPAFKFRDFFLKHAVFIFSSNFTLYGDMSARVMSTLEEFGFPVHIYSIDEAFISLPELSFDEYNALAHAIKNKVKKWTGLPVAVGISSTITLAKLANAVAKKTPAHKNCFVLENAMVESILATFPVEDVWGIGKNSKETLNQKRIYTALELKNGEDKLIRKLLSVKGLKTATELRGISCIEENDREFSKSIVSSRSFGKEVSSLEELKESISFHTATIGEKLRKQNATCAFIGVSIYTNRFNKTSEYFSLHASFPLAYGSSYTPLLIHYALLALNKIYKEGLLYKKAGVFVSEITSNDHLQFDLWQDNTKRKKQEDLMDVFDNVKSKFGKKSLFFAAEGTNQCWRAKASLKSPSYTTRWEDLPVVNTSRDA